MKIIDSHMHFGECDNISDSVKRYDVIIKKYDYDKIVAVSLPYCSKHNYQLDETANINYAPPLTACLTRRRW